MPISSPERRVPPLIGSIVAGDSQEPVWAPRSIDFSAKFKCIGPGCEDTCCSGWSVPVDETAARRLLTLPMGPLRVLAQAAIEPISAIPEGSAASRDAPFAAIRRTAAGNCAFLSDERLCRIQAEAGEAFQPLGCQLYPRIRHRIDGVVETSLSLSCPEAARVVLLDAELFRSLPAGAPGAEPSPGERNLRAFFWPLRRLQLELVLDRRIPIAGRVQWLGRLANALEDSLSGASGISVSEAIAAFRASMRESAPRLTRDPQTESPQLVFILEAIDVCLAEVKPGSRLADSVTGLLAAIGYTPEASLAELTHRYRRSAAGAEPFFERYPQLLENYLANYLFRNLFPFGWSSGAPMPGLEFRKLGGQFLVIYGLLVGAAGSSSPVEDAVQAIQAFTRAVEHSAERLASIASLFERHLGAESGSLDALFLP